jgi:hypothetical protein
MMTTQAPFRVYFADAGATVRQVTLQLEATGMRVVKSFDLRSACASFTENVCPHHSTSPCDCQLVVLLIYGTGALPVSLILHGHRGQTELQWDNAPEFRPGPEGRALILQALDGSAGLWLESDRETYADVE